MAPEWVCPSDAYARMAMKSVADIGLEVWLCGRALAEHAQSPGGLILSTAEIQNGEAERPWNQYAWGSSQY